MNSVGKILCIAGLGAAIIGGFDVSLLLRGTRLPEKVTITKLGAIDGTNNVHLAITDFQFGDGMVIEEKEGQWKRIWIPMLTLDGKWTDRPVVLHTNSVANGAELEKILRLKSVTGIVSNFMQSLGSNQQAEFAKSYPNDDLSGAIAIRFDGRFPTPVIAYPLTISGGIAFAVGIAMSFGWFRQSEPVATTFSV